MGQTSSAQQKLERTQRQSATIIRLSLGGQGGDLKLALRDVTESAARVLGAEYASVWLIDEAARRIRCAVEFDAALMTHRDGHELAIECCTSYLQALSAGRSIAASDVTADPRTIELRQGELASPRIISSLDAALRVPGKLVGFVSHQTTTRREWEDDEVAFACAIADHVSQVLLNEERKNAQAELERQRSELNRLQRVAMLAELCGTLAHELNQPLAAILINAQAAQEYLKPGKLNVEELKAIIRDIADDDRRAGEVMRRLHVLFPRGQVQQQLLDVNAMVRDTLTLMQSGLETQMVTTETHLGANLPPVNADQVQMQQVLLNLLANGCDAMSDLSPPLRKLAVRTECNGDRWVRISVIDRGRGIPQEQLDKIFKPFSTSSDTGLGLGLSVCRSIVLAHGGKLCAFNEAQGGARFDVLLPAAH